MNKPFIYKSLESMLYALAIALPVALMVHLDRYCIQICVLAVTLCGAFSLAMCKGSLIQKKLKHALAWVSIILIAIIVTAKCLWPRLARFDVPTVTTVNPGISGKVLLLCPHQDDEINMLGGAFESIPKGCEILVLYSTNGEGIRTNEAIRALALFGIKEDHVCFLGYDQCAFPLKQKHMYNSKNGEVVSSRFGRNCTMNAANIRCFREGRLFTQKNYEEDLHEYIQLLRPDVIIVTDFDEHPDHRALGLSTERILGTMMKNDPSWRPLVLKSFAYSCSWYQPSDYYSENLGSTIKLEKGDTMNEVSNYKWEERVRLPIGKSSLSLSLSPECNTTATAFSMHQSQQVNDVLTIGRMCNGDKVFWWRPTQNEMLEAQVCSETGDASQLNDFLLFDSKNISDSKHKPYDHGWLPAGGRGTAQISWLRPKTIGEIHLFDHNDPDDQIKHLTIRLSNGQEIEVKNLPPNGTRYIVKTNCSEAITGFTVCIDESTGEGSGLSEIEAYASAPNPPFHITKLQDAEGNFMYDYITKSDGHLDFSVYAWGCEASQMKVALRESTSQQICLQGEAGKYRLYIPQGESCILEVSNANGQVEDAAKISNPNELGRCYRRVVQLLDPYIIRMSWNSQKRYYSRFIDWLTSTM